MKKGRKAQTLCNYDGNKQAQYKGSGLWMLSHKIRKNLQFTLMSLREMVHSVFTTMPSEWQVTIGGLGADGFIKGHDILTGNPDHRKGRT